MRIENSEGSTQFTEGLEESTGGSAESIEGSTEFTEGSVKFTEGLAEFTEGSVRTLKFRMLKVQNAEDSKDLCFKREYRKRATSRILGLSPWRRRRTASHGSGHGLSRR